MTGRADYLEAGYECIPLKPRSKLPLASSWQARPPFRQWQAAPADANVGLRAGEGRAFIDCDDKSKPGTFENVTRWMDGLGYPPGSYPVVQTASGVGRHIYVNFTGDLNRLFGSKKNLKMGAGEFRYNRGAYVAAPPSVVEDGREYRLIGGTLSSLPALDLTDIQALVDLTGSTSNAKALTLSRAVQALAQGRRADRYDTRSEGEAALVLSLINTGHDFETIRVVFDEYPCFGHYAELVKHKGAAEARRWLYVTYQKELVYSHNESPVRRTIRELMERAEAAPWARIADKRVFVAHLQIAHQAARLTYAAGCRDLALRSGFNKNTATNATRRIVALGLLAYDAPAVATLANQYTLSPDSVGHFLSTLAVRECPMKSQEGQRIAASDAFRNPSRYHRGRLGRRAGEIYALALQRPMTVQELSVQTGATVRVVERALKRMAAVKDPATGEVIEMVREEAGTWASLVVDLDQIAAIFDAYGATGKLRERFERERRNHLRSLELGTLRAGA